MAKNKIWVVGLVVILVLLMKTDKKLGIETLLEYNQDTSGSAEKDIFGHKWAGQTFTIGFTTNPGQDVDITKFKLYGYKVGNPGHITVKVYNVDIDHKPIGNYLTIGGIDEINIPDSISWFDIPLMNSYGLTADTEYAIVMHADSGTTSSDSINLRYTEGYDGGIRLMSTDDGGSWTGSSTYDFSFEIWGIPKEIICYDDTDCPDTAYFTCVNPGTVNSYCEWTGAYADFLGFKNHYLDGDWLFAGMVTAGNWWVGG